MAPGPALAGLLLASVAEVVQIAAGEVPPSRVHTAVAIRDHALRRAGQRDWQRRLLVQPWNL